MVVLALSDVDGLLGDLALESSRVRSLFDVALEEAWQGERGHWCPFCMAAWTL